MPINRLKVGSGGDDGTTVVPIPIKNLLPRYMSNFENGQYLEYFTAQGGFMGHYTPEGGSIEGYGALSFEADNENPGEQIRAENNFSVQEAGHYTLSFYIQGEGTIFVICGENNVPDPAFMQVILTEEWVRHSLLVPFASGPANGQMAFIFDTQQAGFFKIDALQLEAGEVMTVWEQGLYQRQPITAENVRQGKVGFANGQRIVGVGQFLS